MPLVTRCPHCDSNLQVPSKKVGEIIACPRCHASFLLPVRAQLANSAPLAENHALRQAAKFTEAETQPNVGPLLDEDNPYSVSLVAETRVIPPPLDPCTPTWKDPTALTVVLTTMLWISCAVGVISMLSDFAQLSLASSGSITVAAAQSNDARQQMIAIVELLTFIVTGVAFLMWIYRANLNAKSFGASDMKFTPGWSVGYYFIPFLNLVRPYQAMKEIWQVSTNPRAWKTQPGSTLVGWWWALWIITGFLGNFSRRLSEEVNSPSSLQAATVASIMVDIVDIPLCLVAISLISAIFKKQVALAKPSA